VSILDHTRWNDLRPHLVAEAYVREGGGVSNPRHRIEVRGSLPEDLHGITSPCVACGALMHPIRRRHGATLRGAAGHAYLAATCPLSVRVGCSRTVAARDEYRRIAEALRRNTSDV
jgi:hypothetical protein